MQIKRIIQTNLENELFKGHVVIIYGPRRIGKTTLVKQIMDSHPDQSLYLNCDEPDIRLGLSNRTSTELANLFGSKSLIVIDEAQRVKNIGLTLKLIVDNLPSIQVVATGSSSFDLSNKISEPLTGRHRDFHLHSFSIEELLQINSPIDSRRLLDHRLIYGSYPQVVTNSLDAAQTLKYIARDYLFKDVLEFQSLKNSDLLEKLLTALALQVGHQVAYTELANLLGIDKKTVENYIRILEQAFIIFRLRPFSRNLRKELTKTRKIYFWDTGIRNACLNNFNPLSLRQDTGPLWENYLISERLKFHSNHQIEKNYYFWRTWDQQEIDLVEELAGQLHCFEIKWTRPKKSAPKAWRDTYPHAPWASITTENYLDFTSPTQNHS